MVDTDIIEVIFKESALVTVASVQGGRLENDKGSVSRRHAFVDGFLCQDDYFSLIKLSKILNEQST